MRSAQAGMICPYCKHDFGKPTKQKRTCPACKSTIVMRGGHPVTEAQAEAIDGKREALAEAKWQRKAARIRRDAAAHARAELREYARLGVRTVVVRACYDACDACRRMNGTAHLLTDAVRESPVPVRGCTNDWCRCSLEIGEFGAAYTEAFWRQLTGSRAPTPSRPAKRAGTAKGAGCLVLALQALAVGVFLVAVAAIGD